MNIRPLRKGMCSLPSPPCFGVPKARLKKVNDLCFDCHKEKGEKVAFKHAPVTSEKGCLSCHPPHAAKNKNLLNMKSDELCFSCHTKTKEVKPKVPHPPFTEGECNSCHNPHGSNIKNIIKGQNGQGLLCVPYRCRNEVFEDLYTSSSDGR